MLRTLFLIALLVLPVHAQAQEATKAVVENYTGDVMEPSFTPDGRVLLFNDNQTSSPEKDIFWARRLGNHRFKFMGRVADVNSMTVDGTPVVDVAGNFYFISMRDYARKKTDTIYHARFNGTNGKVTDVAVIPGLGGEFGYIDMDVEISGDGSALYISRGDFRKGAPPKSARLIRAVNKDGVWQIDPDSEAHFANINKDGMVYAAEPSRDELAVYYTKGNFKTKSFAIMKATRKSKTEAFENPEVVYAAEGLIEAPAVSYDGRLLYFHMQKPGDKVSSLYSIPLK
jgi:hypothetical protein